GKYQYAGAETQRRHVQPVPGRAAAQQNADTQQRQRVVELVFDGGVPDGLHIRAQACGQRMGTKCAQHNAEQAEQAGRSQCDLSHEASSGHDRHGAWFGLWRLALYDLSSAARQLLMPKLVTLLVERMASPGAAGNAQLEPRPGDM